MSTSPGVTYRPDASTVFNARDGSMWAATSGDLAVCDSHVANRVDFVFPVDHMAACEEQIELRLRHQRGRQKEEEVEESHFR